VHNKKFLPQPPSGKSVIALEAYAQESMLTNACSENRVVNELGMVSDPSPEVFTAVQVSANSYCFMPGPELSTTLYRGQHTKYKQCKPNIFRNEKQCYGEYIYWYLKLMEMNFVIQKHPGIIEVSNHWQIGSLRFEINPVAIAQHYDFKTNMLDLTRSKNVAMFFATHKLNRDGKWVAALGNSAVLYSVSIAKLIKKGVIPVGFGVFPRPYVQKAFLIELQQQDDFAKLSEVKSEEFIVTKKLAKYAHDAVGGVKGLFPYDPFEHELNRIKNNKIVPRDVIEIAFRSGQIPPELKFNDVEKHLNNAGYQVQDVAFQNLSESFSNDDIHQTWSNLRKEFWPKMRFRFSSPHMQI
jgi:hypothetical protein